MRHRFGRRAEQLDPDQLALALEEVEQTLAAAEAVDERSQAARPSKVPRRRKVNRGALPAHLPREEVVLDVADKSCACCGALKVCIGEDTSQRLDVVPAQLKVIVTRRPKYGLAGVRDSDGTLPTANSVHHSHLGAGSDMKRVTLGKSRVREIRPPGSVRAKAEWLSYSTTIHRAPSCLC